MRFMAIPLFQFLVIIATIVYMLFDIKSKKKKSQLRRLVSYSFAIYLFFLTDVTMGAIYIPPKESFVSIQLIPLHFLDDWYLESERGTWFVLNSIKLTFYNFIMLIPLGVYLRLLFNLRSMTRVSLIVFLVSLTIEILQLILSYFGLLFSRTFNVDDLILNTIGGIVGYKIWLRTGMTRFGASINEQLESDKIEG